MGSNKERHLRKSIRLSGYDYSQQGAYFITICTKNRKKLFGKIINSKMELNNAGTMIQTIWNELPTRFDNIILDESIIMPNHTHGIIIITPDTPKHPSTGEPCVRPYTTQRTYTTKDIIPYSPNTSPNSNKNHINKKSPDNNLTSDNHSDNNHTGTTHTAGDHKDRPYGTLTGSLGRIIQAFKSITTHEYTINVKHNEWVSFSGKLWHRNYWEHIVRDEMELNRIRQYIQNNPAKWHADKFNYKNGNIVMEKPEQYGVETWMV